MKKAIVALLAGVLCVGGFAACGEEETGNNNQATLNGEVTQKQWVSALEGLDLSNYTVDFTADGHTNSYSQNISINFVRNENKLKYHYYELKESETSNKRTEYTRYATKADGTVYVFGEEDDAYVWGKNENEEVSQLFEDCSTLKMLVTGDNGEELPGLKTLSEIVESAKSDMSGYTYDSEKELYYTLGEEKTYEYDTGTTYTVGIEVEFSEGEVYIRQRVNLFGSREGYMQECWSFEKKTVELPAQDELNLWLNGTVDGVCDDCASEEETHYYDGSEECLGTKGEYCNACIYEKEPALVTDGICDDCGAQEDLYYLDGSEEYYGIEGEYCSDCATVRMIEEIL